MRVARSCCTTTNCVACEDGSLSAAERSACYARGCCCFSAVCTDADCCSGDARLAKRDAYGCAEADAPIVLPQTSLIGISVFCVAMGLFRIFTFLDKVPPLA